MKSAIRVCCGGGEWVLSGSGVGVSVMVKLFPVE